MSWTDEARKRAIRAVFTGAREFALVQADGTEYQDGKRVAGFMSAPVLVGEAWRATNEELLEFPEFPRTLEGTEITGVAIYDGAVRIAVVDAGPVAVVERIQIVLRPRDLWVGVGL